MNGTENSLANQPEDLDIQIEDLEKQQTQLKEQHKGLSQELEQLYTKLMAKFERHWPPLKTSGE